MVGLFKGFKRSARSKDNIDLKLKTNRYVFMIYGENISMRRLLSSLVLVNLYMRGARETT